MSLGTLSGYVAMCDLDGQRDGRTVVIQRGAFDHALLLGVPAVLDHDFGRVLAVEGQGLRLWADSGGLRFELAIPDNDHGRKLVKRWHQGRVLGCSFSVPRGSDRRSQSGHRDVIHRVERLDDVSISTRSEPTWRQTLATLRFEEAPGASPGKKKKRGGLPGWQKKLAVEFDGRRAW
jgi:HK97 family phage prohead protease